MNKAELIAQIAEDASITKTQANAALDSFVDTVTKTLKKGDKVTLVGFGPGDPDLLTIAGDKALAKADVIFHDDLVDKDFLDNYKAKKVYVGKRRRCHSHEQDEINQLICDAALAGNDDSK